MVEDNGAQRPYALDYTPIVKHRGKQFTIGDLSLSKINGIDLQSAAVASVPAVIVGVGFAVVFFITGITVFFAIIPALLAAIGTYLWFSRETTDSQAPWGRVLMAITVRRNAPVRISGGLPTVRSSNVLSELVGRKHAAADNYPTTLRWLVIVKRGDPAHMLASAAIPNRTAYRPRPAGVEFGVEDDQYIYADWMEYLAKPMA
ncbi:hypothetical protein [Gordonia aichiensis]|uniref:hypothetical protein n=1 Tax=Gordonia aichiensis TaxID=36820 RepID=UPI0032659ABF